MHRIHRGVMTALLAAGLAVATVAPAAAQERSAFVRVVHLSPDAPNVDVYVDGSLTLEGVAYKQASDSLPLPAGSHDVAVRAAGAAADSAPVIQATLNLDVATAYTVAAVGLLDSIQAQVWVGADTRPEDGKAGVRAIHAAPEVGAVDVATGGQVVLSSLAFPNASDYLMLDPGSYELDVRAAGGTDALLSTTAAVEANTLYSIIAVGGGDQAPELIALVDAAGSDTPSVLGVTSGEGGTALGEAGMWLAIAVAVIGIIAAVMIRRRPALQRR